MRKLKKAKVRKRNKKQVEALQIQGWDRENQKVETRGYGKFLKELDPRFGGYY